MAVSSTSKRPIVLIHGAWHGGWCWREVARLLRAAGHPVTTPTLTGLGERHHLAHPEVDVDLHVTDILNHLAAQEFEQPLVVGHSYAGLVLSGVADILGEGLGRPVFLDARVPQDGQSLFDLVGAGESAVEQAKANAIDGYLVPAPPPIWFDIPHAMKDATAWARRRLTPHPIQCFLQKVRLQHGGAAGLDPVFIRCPQRLMAEGGSGQFPAPEGWRTVTLQEGHDIMITAPHLLADTLRDLAA